LAGLADEIAALDLIASLDLKLSRVRVGRDVAVVVAHEDEIAEPLEAAASINHDAVVSRPDWGVFRYRDGNAVTSLAV
jgi:hypothetical protein